MKFGHRGSLQHDLQGSIPFGSIISSLATDSPRWFIAECLTIPYADFRRPPITLAELDRARTQLSAKGHAQPTEDLIFATQRASDESS